MVHPRRRRLPRLVPLALCLLAGLPAGLARAAPDAPDTPPISLRPQWEKGQTTRYSFWNSRTTTTHLSVAGRQREATQKLETAGEMTWTVDEVHADGSSVCGMTMDWMTAKLSQGDQTKELDSRKGSGEPAALYDVLSAMTGVELRVQVAADGHITGVSHIDAIRAKADNPEAIPSEQDFIESATDLATVPYAPQAPQPGATWDASFDWTHEMGTMTHKTHYTLASVQPMAGIPVATIKHEDALSLDIDRSDIPANAPPIDAQLVNGTCKGEILFDLTRHEAVGRNSVQTETIEVDIQLPQQRTLRRRIERKLQSQVLRIQTPK